MNKINQAWTSYLIIWICECFKLCIYHIFVCVTILFPPNLQITDAHRVKERASEVFWISIQWGCCVGCVCVGSQLNCLVENENLYAKTTILFDVMVWLCIDGFSRCHSSETVLNEDLQSPHQHPFVAVEFSPLSGLRRLNFKFVMFSLSSNIINTSLLCKLSEHNSILKEIVRITPSLS